MTPAEILADWQKSKLPEGQVCRNCCNYEYCNSLLKGMAPFDPMTTECYWTDWSGTFFNRPMKDRRKQ